MYICTSTYDFHVMGSFHSTNLLPLISIDKNALVYFIYLLIIFFDFRLTVVQMMYECKTWYPKYVMKREQGVMI